jgi:hypothetical protein
MAFAHRVSRAAPEAWIPSEPGTREHYRNSTRYRGKHAAEPADEEWIGGKSSTHYNPDGAPARQHLAESIGGAAYSKIVSDINAVMGTSIPSGCRMNWLS